MTDPCAPRPDAPGEAGLCGRTLLICAGAMKASTSWLHERLRRTPGCAPSPLKEVHFFDARFPRLAILDVDGYALRRLAWHMGQEGDPAANLRARPAFRASVDRVRMIYDDAAYFDHFASLAGPGTRVFADLTPAYAVIGREGFAFMRRSCEARGLALKIVFVMRDPVARLWSHMRFLPQLGQAVDPLTDWPALLEDPAVIARSDYRGTLEDLEAVMAPGTVLPLFHETLAETGLPALRAALGLAPPAEEGDDGPVNVTRLQAALPAEAEAAFRRALAPQYAWCRERFGPALPAAWRRVGA
ncbi:hypothetical protein [Albimonas pacifica]|uniref:Sulfotransferase family protein n=1 Tax=Albimonas pacifica TaxID=1114924 RepID=A0A1I3HS79_9RHOB|nr:hypothetical protein [Albimonas pacifica]SFI38417.1 hypothetical protein SAMN05216258_106139 [Albimonas pacifica]